MRATFADFLEGSAWLSANGNCLNAYYDENTHETVVEAYPDPNMPDSHEIMRVQGSNASRVRKAIKDHFRPYTDSPLRAHWHNICSNRRARCI